jgi:hypothetical protein
MGIICARQEKTVELILSVLMNALLNANLRTYFSSHIRSKYSFSTIDNYVISFYNETSCVYEIRLLQGGKNSLRVRVSGCLCTHPHSRPSSPLHPDKKNRTTSVLFKTLMFI